MAKLRNRLLTYFLPLSMVPILLASAASVTIMQRMAREQFTDRLDASFRGVAMEMDELKADMHSRAATLAGDRELAEAIAAGDGQTLLGILERSIGTLRVQEAVAVGADGIVLAEGHHPTDYGMRASDLGGMPAELGLPTVRMEMLELGVGIAAAQPVTHAGQVVGRLTLARLLDYRFLENIRGKYGVEAAVYDGDRLQAVTFRDPRVITDTDLDAVRHRVSHGEHDARQDVMLAGRRCFVTGQQILSDAGAPIGTLIFAFSTQNMYDLMRILVAVYVAIAMVLLVLTIAITFRVTGTVVEPIGKLIRMTQRVASGDLSARVWPRSRDEVGQLAVALNDMAEDLQQTTTSVETLNREIAERKRIERERQQLIEKLETQNTELERFTYTVSHDLKSPLITISGYVGMLQQDLAEGKSEQMAEDLSRISNAAEKMSRLLNDLLELSRLGRLVNPSEDVSLNELAHEAIELVDGQLRKNGVEVEISADLPVLFGDRLRLSEVMQNLIDNAVKYMGDQPHPRIEIGARRNGDETICYVRDNGIGIDPRYHEKVFGLFDQLDPKVEGTGIGLSVVKRIIEVHGGRIWVESEGLGHGSTFCFTVASKE